MQLPKKYSVLYGGKFNNEKQRYTNDENTAFKWSVKYNGIMYIDTRYNAKLRLYWYLWRKNEYNK
jgi:hypothetical protein